MQKKADFSKKILASLSGKRAASIEDLEAELTSDGGKRPAATDRYALARSLRNLTETGLVERLASPNGEYARLTQKGRQRAASAKLDSKTSLANPAWDGKWRIVLLDLPESRKAERDALRYLLKKAGFVLLKNSAWVSPFPFEFLFQNIKKDFGLSSELMVIVTDTLDEETERLFRAAYAA